MLTLSARLGAMVIRLDACLGSGMSSMGFLSTRVDSSADLDPPPLSCLAMGAKEEGGLSSRRASRCCNRVATGTIRWTPRCAAWRAEVIPGTRAESTGGAVGSTYWGKPDKPGTIPAICCSCCCCCCCCC